MENSLRKAIYPGTFDPPHKGHVDLIRRGCRLFDEVVVAVAVNRDKKATFDLDRRIDWLRRCCEPIEGARIEGFDGLVVDLMAREGSRTILRGIRTFADFEAEYTMALTNRSLSGDLDAETVFVLPTLEYSHFSSRLVKEVAAFGGDITDFLPIEVAEEVSAALRSP